MEPRKGHRSVLEAFQRLLDMSWDAGLIIVGKLGWKMEAFAAALRSSRENGHRLQWIEKATDGDLHLLYGACAALIMASEAEGFGLPVVEAAAAGLPAIVRDIPVFRETAGLAATYFSGGGEALAAAVQGWLASRQNGEVPDPRGIQVLDWDQSVQHLSRLIFNDACQEVWTPPPP